MRTVRASIAAERTAKTAFECQEIRGSVHTSSPGCTAQPSMINFALKEKSLMATLHVRSVPEDLYERIQNLARSRSRSLSAEVITLLYQALEEEESRKRQGIFLHCIALVLSQDHHHGDSQ